MTIDIRMMSYNCRGWISCSAFVELLLCDVDLLLIQEHWLFTEVSGRIVGAIIRGRPFGGCGFFINRISMWCY